MKIHLVLVIQWVIRAFLSRRTKEEASSATLRSSASGLRSRFGGVGSLRSTSIVNRLSSLVVVLSALMMSILVGCVSSEKFYQDVSLSRETAYRQWAGRKEHQQQSQTHISGELSIEDCLKLALVNNKVLQSVLQEKEIARGERLKSYSAILPTVDLTAEYQRLDEVSSMSIPSGPSITMGDVDNYSVGLRVTQPVFAGGAIPATINAGKLFSLLTDQTVRSEVQNLIYSADSFLL